jgi:hypothetical protein
VDTSGPITSEASPPPPAQVILAFWNTMPAYSPAQAMRRWDGAHTGPAGARHGLYNLLRTARGADIPLVLLDLTNPFSLSAVDYAGGLALIQEMSKEGMLILPEVGPSPTSQQVSNPEIINRSINASHAAAQKFNLETSHFLYAPLSSALPGRYEVLFLHKVHDQSNPGLRQATVGSWRGLKVIPLPGQDNQTQVSLDGPTQETRRSLVETALSPENINHMDSRHFLILGGSLPESYWGDPRAATAAFTYFKRHPWIKVLGTHDLKSIQAGRPYTPPMDLQDTVSNINESMLTRLHQAPDNPITEAAWYYALSLHAPVYPYQSLIETLREHYSGQLGILLFAAGWVENPQPRSDCSLDLDHDHQLECILASENVLTIFNLETGDLIWVFIRYGHQIHQVIGPTSQLVLGQSDQSSWNLDLWGRADPDVISGITRTNLARTNAMSLDENTITFTYQNGFRTYIIQPDGFSVISHSTDLIQLHVPLIFDPWERFSPNWGDGYQGARTDTGYFWQNSTNDKVILISTNPLTINSFIDTREHMGRKENPNFDYLPGHYLPFPLSLVEISGRGEVELRIRLESP